MRLPTIVAFVALALGAGCSGISVSSDFDPAADFSKLKTFAWQDPPQGMEGWSGRVSQLTHERIRSAIDDTLVARGYAKAASPESADFEVTYRAAVKREIEAYPATTSVGYGHYGRGGYGYGYGYGGTEIRTYDRGTLVIDVFDPRAKKLMWRGTAKGTVDEDRSPEEREERVREAVAMVLERFPPQKEK